MRPLALIPARSGSKRLPGKNMLRIGERTLVEIAVEQAQAAGIFGDRIAITTDDPGMLPSAATVAQPWSYVDRPAELARDDSPTMPAVRHAVRELREAGWVFDAVILLQPTSPLRTAADIVAAAALLESAEAVVSVSEPRQGGLFAVSEVTGRLRPLLPQEAGAIVAPNGAVFGVKTSVLDLHGDWWTATVTQAYVMPAGRSIDIDDRADYELARQIWQSRTN